MTSAGRDFSSQEYLYGQCLTRLLRAMGVRLVSSRWVNRRLERLFCSQRVPGPVMIGARRELGRRWNEPRWAFGEVWGKMFEILVLERVDSRRSMCGHIAQKFNQTRTLSKQTCNEATLSSWHAVDTGQCSCILWTDATKHPQHFVGNSTSECTSQSTLTVQLGTSFKFCFGDENGL